MPDKFVKPRPGGVVQVEIEGLNVKGQGIGSYGEYQVLVRGSIPGDTVLSRFRKVYHRRREGEARIIERISQSVERVDPACGHFGVCGGCLWQDVPYGEQTRSEGHRRNRTYAVSPVSVGVPQQDGVLDW